MVFMPCILYAYMVSIRHKLRLIELLDLSFNKKDNMRNVENKDTALTDLNHLFT